MAITIPVTVTGGICPCCGPACDCECAAGIGYWSEYTFTIAGIEGDDSENPCRQCPQFNGSWTLKYRGGCTWSTDGQLNITTPPCRFATLPGPAWAMTCIDGVLALSANEFSYVYTFDLSVMATGGTGTLSFFDYDQCEYPGTVTIATGGTFVACSPPPSMSVMSEQADGKFHAKIAKPRPPCSHLGKPTGESVTCKPCRGGLGVELKTFTCTEFGRCTVGKKVDDVACCVGCDRYEPPAANNVTEDE